MPIVMQRRRIKQTLKLRFLAFVLAAALLWYSISPAPGFVVRIKREDEAPDEKKREAAPEFKRAIVLPAVLGTPGAGLSSLPSPNRDDEDDDFDWPEFIDG